VHRLQFHYTLGRDSSPALIRNPLIDLLQAVSTQGSISAGARALGLSYRHVWGELKRWEGELGNELIIWEKGQSARLTEFGAKLMWAERQAQARLAPQIESLRSDLERAFAVAFDDNAHVVTLYASHDDALAQLRAHTAEAIALGVFGVPTLVVDGHLFWGLDALPMLRAYLAGDAWFDGPDWAQAASVAQGVRRVMP